MMEKQVLLCHCGGERISPDLLQAVELHLRTMPVKTTRLSDLCGLAVLEKSFLAGLLSEGTEVLIIGCYRRTMYLLLEQINGYGGKTVTFNHINLLDKSLDEAFGLIDAFCADLKDDSSFREISEKSGWPAWYPVIDYSRCTACGQCADFCLFGVYEKTENRIKVINPEGCKTNCPACARICPSTAIIFPKYKDGGAVGGSDDIDERAELKRQSTDIEKFIGDDIYKALQNRKAKRASIIREEVMKRAFSERDKALKENLNN